jgi:hypothetical protein
MTRKERPRIGKLILEGGIRPHLSNGTWDGYAATDPSGNVFPSHGLQTQLAKKRPSNSSSESQFQSSQKGRGNSSLGIANPRLSSAFVHLRKSSPNR